MPDTEAKSMRGDAYDLTLSGGGFRATLFHLGVILHIVARSEFSKIQRVFAVSGGAVLAAHLLQHCDEYDDVSTQDKRVQLFTALRELLDPIVRGNFRNQVLAGAAILWFPIVCMFILSAWLVLRDDFGFDWRSRFLAAAIPWTILLAISWRFGIPKARNWMAERLYRSQYLPASFGFFETWLQLKGRRLDVRILATDMLTGRLGEFSRNGFRLYDEELTEVGKRAKQQAISRAVAASTAFPPVFPPHRLQIDNLLCHLTDGGVFDNLGIEAIKKDPAQHECIVSDAGGEFVSTVDGGIFDWTVLRNMRASEIVMNRLATKDVESFSRPVDPVGGLISRPIPVHVNIRCPLANSSIPECAADVPRIRTDLNRFTRNEAVALIMHGADHAAGNFGELKGDQRDTFLILVRGGLRLKDDDKLQVPANSLANSHRSPFQTLILFCVFLYLLPLLIAFHSFGALPQRLLGSLSNFFSGPPEFVQLRDQEHLQKTVRNLNSSNFADELATINKYTSDAGKEIAYYECSCFFGPEFETEITIPMESYTGAGNKALLAVLVVPSNTGEALIPLTATWSPENVTIYVPSLLTKGWVRILLVSPGDGLSKGSRWKYTAE